MVLFFSVLELSEKYQKRFGPLRYFVAGFLKFLCLPKYNYEVEYLPALKEDQEDQEGKLSTEREAFDMSDLYKDIMRRSSKEHGSSYLLDLDGWRFVSEVK